MRLGNGGIVKGLDRKHGLGPLPWRWDNVRHALRCVSSDFEIKLAVGEGGTSLWRLPGAVWVQCMVEGEHCQPCGA